MNDYIYQKNITYLSRYYKKLCEQGIIIHNYETDKNVIKMIDLDDDLDQLKQQNDELLLPQGYHCVIGRGFYKGYLVRMKCRASLSSKLDKLKDEIKSQFSKKVNDKEINELLNQSIINTEEKFNGTSKYYLEI